MKYVTFKKLMSMLLIASASIAATFIAPAFPAINLRFSGGPHHELCMSIYLFGYLAGIIFHVPICEKMGTGRAIKLGLLIAFIATIVQLWSYQSPQNSITFFLLSRFFIGYGLAVGLVCGMVEARSNLNEAALKAFLSQLAIFFKVSIYLSILLGGYLATYAGVTYILLITFIFTLFLLIYQPSNKKTAKPNEIVNNSLSARHTSYELIKYSMAVSISTIIAYSYATFSPIVAVNELHLSPFQFSLINILNMFGVFVGAIFYQEFIGSRYDDRIIVNVAIAVGLVLSSGIALLGEFPITNITTWMFFIIGCAMNILSGIIYPAGSFLCLNSIKNIALSSSIMNFFKIGAPALTLFIVKEAKGGDFLKLAIAIIAPCSVYFALYVIEHLFRRKLVIRT